MKNIKNSEEFYEIIKGKKVLVDFYADWCGPCQMLMPVLEEFAKKHEDIEVIEVNTDDFLELAREYNVMSIPSLKLFNEGKLVKETLGYHELKELEDFVK